MKFKIGDKIRVREDLEIGKYYDFYLNEEMAKLKGKVVEIEDVLGDSEGYFYSIKELDGYIWTSEMFSGLAEEPRNLIPLIAKELGVEIGERFIIGMPDIRFYFDDNSLRGESLDGKENDFNYDDVFINLISGKTLLNKLPQKPKLTEAEKVILENLPKEYKWIARDLSENIINVFYEKPQKRTVGLKVWSAPADNEELYVYNHLFQFIKWEDEEPYSIKKLLGD